MRNINFCNSQFEFFQTMFREQNLKIILRLNETYFKKLNPRVSVLKTSSPHYDIPQQLYGSRRPYCCVGVVAFEMRHPTYAFYPTRKGINLYIIQFNVFFLYLKSLKYKFLNCLFKYKTNFHSFILIYRIEHRNYSNLLILSQTPSKIENYFH